MNIAMTKFQLPCRLVIKRGIKTKTDICVKIVELTNSFRNRGHFAALLDPLGAVRTAAWLPEDVSEYPDVVQVIKNYPHPIDLSPYDLQDISMSEVIDLGESERFRNYNGLTVRELVASLVDSYCGSVGIEYNHIENVNQRRWLENKVEHYYGPKIWSGLSDFEKLKNLNHLLHCHSTATFLNLKFPAAKVFGIEGCEALIPGLHALVESASTYGMESIEMGMAHRGRMNVLVNFFKKPLRSICNNFNETEPSELGDVKYHLGTRTSIEVLGLDGYLRRIHLSLAANPSHLEAVNPIVIGKTKAKQFYLNDETKRKVMPILLHGDAAFSGQGIVPEVLELSNLPDYTVGGCVHIIINNQIGFTTDPRLARTSYHCTSIAKGIGAPIFHVNGDDVDAVVNVCRLAGEWRQTFSRDCIVDIVCYRRHGHNSLDDPSITQPHIYQIIEKHPPVLDIYSNQLIDSNIISPEMLQYKQSIIDNEYECEYEIAKSYKPDPLEWLASNWQGDAIGTLLSERPYNQTGVRLETLLRLGYSLTHVPADFVLHKDIEKLLQLRKKILDNGEGVTMAFAESLAFACLMNKYTPSIEEKKENNNDAEKEKAKKKMDDDLHITMKEHPTVHIRLSGQDCIRGTFNQRHAAIFCQQTNREYWQLNHLNTSEQAQLSVCNSSLSEAAILGFEYGYSLSNDMALTIWEAQFGDFANVAQSIIDNFIVSGEYKWNNKSSLVMLLPHGFDGQGPEHSSARLERYLQLVDDDCDAIPGKGIYSTIDIDNMFQALVASENNTKNDNTKGNRNESTKTSTTTTTSSSSSSSSSSSPSMNRDIITKEAFKKAVKRYAPHIDDARIDLSFAEILSDYENFYFKTEITKDVWRSIMISWLQSNSERRHNLIVINPSTPAQYFHGLRRQIHRPFAKPVVIMSAKWLLHHKACISNIEDMSEGTFFHRVIVEGGRGDNMCPKRDITNPYSHTNPDHLVSPEKIRKVIFCSGAIFYHLYHARAAAKINDITIVRVEQIAPFPYDLITPVMKKCIQADFLWVQEEPKNMGAWSYVKPRFDTTCREEKLDNISIRYVGRRPCASPATGGYKQHYKEQKEILAEALS